MSKNTIDTILAEAIDRSVVGEDRTELFNQAKQALYQDLMALVGSHSKFREPEDELDRGVQIGYDTLRTEIIESINQYFKRGEENQ